MNPYADHLIRCEECQSENPPGEKICWLCHAKLDPKNEIVLAELVENTPVPSLTSTFFTMLIFACVVLMILVGIGIAQDSPGMLVGYGILLIPPLLVTLCHSLLRRAQDKPVTPLQIFLTFMISSLVTVAIVVVLLAITIIVGVLYVIRVCFGGGM